MRPTIEFRETMRGHWRPHGEPRPRAIELTVVAHERPGPMLSPRRVCDLAGAIEVEGLAASAAARGSLVIDPLLGKTLAYALSFDGDDGAAYRFDGKKSVRFLRLAETMTTLEGGIYDARDARVGEATLRFDLRDDFVRWIGTFRLRR